MSLLETLVFLLVSPRVMCHWIADAAHRLTVLIADWVSARECENLMRNRAYRRRGLAVTDLTASEWCQQQVAYTLSAKIPRVSCRFCLHPHVLHSLYRPSSRECCRGQSATFCARIDT